MAKTKTYTVTYERDEKGLWVAHAGEEKLRELNVKAARALTHEVGLSLRDAGELLGASKEAVRQWVEAS